MTLLTIHSSPQKQHLAFTLPHRDIIHYSLLPAEQSLTFHNSLHAPRRDIIHHSPSVNKKTFTVHSPRKKKSLQFTSPREEIFHYSLFTSFSPQSHHSPFTHPNKNIKFLYYSLHRREILHNPLPSAETSITIHSSQQKNHSLFIIHFSQQRNYSLFHFLLLPQINRSPFKVLLPTEKFFTIHSCT